MMKLILGISIILNFILIYLVLNQRPEKEVVERLIIESHAEKRTMPRPVKTRPAPSVSSKKEEQKEVDQAEFVNLGPNDFQDAGEKMEADRVEFLTEKLGLSEDKISEHNRIRDDYFKQTAQFWQKNPIRELSFKERREMIEMEEKLHQKLQKLHGKKNWERYQKYRDNYNQQGYKKQMEENQPFIFMGL